MRSSLTAAQRAALTRERAGLAPADVLRWAAHLRDTRRAALLTGWLGGADIADLAGTLDLSRGGAYDLLRRTLRDIGRAERNENPHRLSALFTGRPSAPGCYPAPTPRRPKMQTDPELILTAVPGGYQVDLIDHDTSTWPLLRLHATGEGVTTRVDEQRGEIILSTEAHLHAGLLSSVDLFAQAFTTLARRLREQGPAPLGALLTLLRDDSGADVLAPAFALEGDPRGAGGEVMPTAPLSERRAGIGGPEPRLILVEGGDAGVNDEARSLRLITCEPPVTPPHEAEQVTVYHVTDLRWPPGVTGPDSALVPYDRTHPFGFTHLLMGAAQAGVTPITGTVTRLDISLGRVIQRILATGERFTAEQVLLAAEQLDEDTSPRDFFRVIDRMAHA